MKKFFIVLGIVLVVVIVGGGIYIYFNRENLANMAIEQALNGVEQVTTQNLPSGYTADDVKQLIADAKVKIQEKGFNSPELQQLMTSFQQVYEDQVVDTTEAKMLLEDLKEIVE
jgi:hypothetical protein